MAAVSIQLMPISNACRMASSDAASSCVPQPNAHPPPPTAHAPKPTTVISRPLEPKRRVGNFVAFDLCILNSCDVFRILQSCWNDRRPCRTLQHRAARRARDLAAIPCLVIPCLRPPIACHLRDGNVEAASQLIVVDCQEYGSTTR